MPDERWKILHDATLETVEADWASGAVTVHLRTGLEGRRHLRIVASSVVHMEYSRLMPWGPSVSINGVRESTLAGSATRRLVVEMQTGDVLIIDAKVFSQV